MTKHLWLVATATFMLVSAHAQTPDHHEGGCPAHRAAQAGLTAFDDFHHVMAPAWHEAWPNDDWEALFDAGAEFTKAFEAVAEMEPEFKTDARAERFIEVRKRLDSIIVQYAAACEAKDTAGVHDLMPALHDAFEETASALLPVDYPEINGLIITTNLIVETHLPKGNMEGIAGSTETLVRKCQLINEATIPPELSDRKEDVLKDVAGIRRVVMKMQECCQTEDMNAYKQHAETLRARLQTFLESYL